MAGKPGRTRTKSFAFEPDFLEELQRQRRAFMEDQADILWESLNGNLSEGAFLQMIARAGIAQLTTKGAREALWEYLPATARGFKPDGSRE